MSEEEIYSGCRRGDNAARRELYDRYGRALLAIGVRYVSDYPTAEDILHDVMVGVLTNFGKFSFRGEGSLKSWLSRVMVNACLDYLRRRRISPEMAVEELPDEEADCLGEESAADVPAGVIMDFIRRLPDGYRTVFNLFVFEGKSHKEIAEELGINEKSSSSQLTRAKKLLARQITEYKKGTTI